MFSWIFGTKEDRERLADAKERIRQAKEELRKMDQVEKIQVIVNKKKHNLSETLNSFEIEGSGARAEYKTVDLIQDAGTEKLKIKIEFLSGSNPGEDKHRDNQIISIFCRGLWSDPKFVKRFTRLLGPDPELLVVTVSYPNDW